MSTSDCLFCKIIAGDIPSDQVHANDEFVAFRDIAPKADTHVLVVPRRHDDNLDAWVAAGGSSDALLAFASDTARQLGVDGAYRLIANVGPAAGQEVFHLHLHLMAGSKLPGFG
jgi:histidine triad (HIT) family protein